MPLDENAKIVVVVIVAPAASSVDGKFGWLGEFGKCPRFPCSLLMLLAPFTGFTRTRAAAGSLPVIVSANKQACHPHRNDHF